MIDAGTHPRRTYHPLDNHESIVGKDRDFHNSVPALFFAKRSLFGFRVFDDTSNSGVIAKRGKGWRY